MALTGINYFTDGVFTTGTLTGQALFSGGLYYSGINYGVLEFLVDGMFTDDVGGLNGVQSFSFGFFSGVVGGGEGAELIWAHILSGKKRQGQFLPI